MNIAIGTLILFLLFIPGISFITAFNFGPLTKKYSKTSFLENFYWAIIPGIFFQLLFSGFINCIHPYGYEVRSSSLVNILYGQNVSAEFAQVEKELPAIILYNLALVMVAALAGWGLREFLRTTKLHLRWKILRFNNEWWYVLHGEFVFFKQFKGLNLKSAAECYIDALVKVSDSYYLYKGFVDSFYLKKDGTLETIWLRKASKAPFIGNNTEEFMDIESHIFVLNYNEVVNINVFIGDVPPSKRIQEATEEILESIETVMEKPNLTEDQKISFEEKFMEIINEASPEAQQMWQEAGGRVQWLNEKPLLFGVPAKLHGRLADKYVTLMNNLNDRRI